MQCSQETPAQEEDSAQTGRQNDHSNQEENFYFLCCYLVETCIDGQYEGEGEKVKPSK